MAKKKATRRLVAKDVPTYLAKYFPYMNIIAFVGIAIMFLIGGAVLLTVGMNEFKKYSNS